MIHQGDGHALHGRRGVAANVLSALWVRLHDAGGLPVLANVFLTLRDMSADADSSTTPPRRGFVYVLRHEAYVFKALRPGAYLLSVTAAGFEPLEARVTVGGSARSDAAFTLQALGPRERLEFDLHQPRQAAPAGAAPPWAREATALLQDWRADADLVALAGAPLPATPLRHRVEGHVATHLLALGYPYESGAELRRLFWRLVDARVRLGLVVHRLFSHPRARGMARVPAGLDLADACDRALRQIDFLDVHPVYLMLAESLEPWRAVLERVLMSQLSEFNVTVPAGIAAAMVPRPPGQAIPLPSREPLAVDLSASPHPMERLNCMALALANALVASGLRLPGEEGEALMPGLQANARLPARVPARLPTTMTILASYQCTAACESCCFGSHPGIHQRLSRAEILTAIDDAAALGSIQLVVFSGGECFMLEEDLVIAVARCTTQGLATRCVSNGYWARTPEAARERLAPLRDAGLRELNLSTGDFHQAYVDPQCIINAAIAGVALGMRVVVVVESRDGRAFNGHKLLRDPRLEPVARSPLLTVFDSPWMPMQDREHITQSASALAATGNLFRRKPCDSVLDTLVVNPSGVIGACCGLTREQIPEMAVGHVSTGLAAAVQAAGSDFMKIWISVDGPERILAWAAGIDPRIQWEQRYSHHCDACRAVYDDPLVRAVISGHWRDRETDVMQRHALMHVGMQPIPMPGSPGPSFQPS